MMVRKRAARGRTSAGLFTSRRTEATQQAWTRLAGCCGRSRRGTARRSRGPTWSSSVATARWNRWASRPSASAAAAWTSGSPRRMSVCCPANSRSGPAWCMV